MALTERAFSKVGTSDRSAVGDIRTGARRRGRRHRVCRSGARSACMARHPHARITAAMASSASSPARTLPALDRIWEGTIVPFDLAALADATDVVFLALPEDAAGRRRAGAHAIEACA